MASVGHIDRLSIHQGPIIGWVYPMGGFMQVCFLKHLGGGPKMPVLHSRNWANNPKPTLKPQNGPKIGQQMTESNHGRYKKLPGPNCISNTNYSKKCNRNTKYKIHFKMSKIQNTYNVFQIHILITCISNTSQL